MKHGANYLEQLLLLGAHPRERSVNATLTCCLMPAPDRAQSRSLEKFIVSVPGSVGQGFFTIFGYAMNFYNN